MLLGDACTIKQKRSNKCQKEAKAVAVSQPHFMPTISMYYYGNC